jgi:hypothetical protein
MKRAEFQPPRVRDVAAQLGMREEEARELLRRRARMGILVAIEKDVSTIGSLSRSWRGSQISSPGKAGTAGLPRQLFAIASAPGASSPSRYSNS